MMILVKKYWILLLAVIILPTLVVVMNDRTKIKTMLDGAVVTDKTGKSYMLQQDVIGCSYKVYEFDIERMKMVR